MEEAVNNTFTVVTEMSVFIRCSIIISNIVN